MIESGVVIAAMLALGGLALAGLVVAETGLRVAGVGGFALYARDPHSIYRMASNQQGRFRRRARWRYDRFGMRSDVDVGSLAGRIVVLGDSVVEGGLHLDQRDTLAAALERETGHPVSPVACHGWALINELGALAATPGWDEAAALVWVINTGDFDTIGRGENELSFPTRRPVLLTLWLLRRYIYRKNPWWWPWGKRVAPPGPPRPELRERALAEYEALAPHLPQTVVIVGHAMRGEDIRAHRFLDQLVAVRPGAALVVPAESPGWSEDCYLDFIHPNARGAALMAQAIAPYLPRKEP